ncbi:MAG: hypothetical protein H6727_05340 [Myxococcales bacterium]|nr:hypothetical protein [Myxococcales bacterium]
MKRLSRMPLSRRLLLVCAFFLGATQLGSCSYIERFVIRVEEKGDLPCMGVYQMEFTVEKLTEQQEEIVQAKFTEGFQPSDLFWNSQSGSCQIPPIPLKQIPYGGERKLTIVTYDSSGRSVSNGSTPAFQVEKSGDNIQSAVTLSLARRQNMTTGTLIIRFTNDVPATAKRLQFVIKAQGDAKEENLFVTMIDNQPKPKFVILTNVPFANGRTVFARALDGAQALVASSEELSYTIEASSADKMAARLALTFNPANP